MKHEAKCPRCGAQVKVEFEDDSARFEGGWVSVRGFANCGECDETFYGTYECELSRDAADGFEFDDE